MTVNSEVPHGKAYVHVGMITWAFIICSPFWIYVGHRLWKMVFH